MVALSVTLALSAPFDLSSIQAALAMPDVPAIARDLSAKRQAAAARDLYGTVFMPDHPITPVVIDNGTECVEQAIRVVRIRDWIRVMRRFDDAAHQSCLRMAGLAATFAGPLGPCAFARHRSTEAALRHDVGAIHVPAVILNKPGKPDVVETALVHPHPEQGVASLGDQGFAPEHLVVVRSHHEVFDVLGYPDRRRRDAIMDWDRLITVYDSECALIERRPAKAPMSAEKAYAILKERVGRLDMDRVAALHPIATTCTPCLPRDA